MTEEQVRNEKREEVEEVDANEGRETAFCCSLKNDDYEKWIPSELCKLVVIVPFLSLLQLLLQSIFLFLFQMMQMSERRENVCLIGVKKGEKDLTGIMKCSLVSLFLSFASNSNSMFDNTHTHTQFTDRNINTRNKEWKEREQTLDCQSKPRFFRK